MGIAVRERCSRSPGGCCTEGGSRAGPSPWAAASETCAGAHGDVLTVAGESRVATRQ
jgi:hypothetical protein